jgi:hypothetical protein
MTEAQAERCRQQTLGQVSNPLYLFLLLSLSSQQSPTQSNITVKKRTVKPAEASSSITKTLLQSTAKPLTILVVDDSESSRKMTMKLLTMCGHSCHEAKDGYDALHTITDMCEGDRCNSGRVRATVDAVLMDHHMPLMSGKSRNVSLPFLPSSLPPFFSPCLVSPSIALYSELRRSTVYN